MAYAYCTSCFDPIPEPTLADAMVRKIACPHCGVEEARTLDDYEVRAVANEIEEKLRELSNAD